MKRFIPIFLSLVLVLGAIGFAMPSVSAREYLDYNDYITDITVDGDNDLITVEFPVDQAQWAVWLNDEPYTFPVGDKLSMYFHGTVRVGCWVNNNFIDLTNIPADTVFTITYYMDFEVQEDAESELPMLNSWLYYDEGQVVTFPLDFGKDGSRFTYTPDRTYGDGLLFGFITRDIDPYIDNVDFYCQLESFTMQMSISSLYRLQEATGKTNEILQAVEDKLEDQGKTLQDILDKIDSEADPVAPDGSDDVTDTVDKEDQMVNDAVSDYNDNGFVFTDADTFVGDIWTPVLACSAMLSDLIDNNEWLRGMLLIAIAFLVLKLIFSGLNNLDNNTSKKEGDG